MTRSQAAAWATIAAIVGAFVLIYVVSRISPHTPTGAYNSAALFSFYGAIILFTSGLGSIAALALHDRWPALAGVDRRHPAALPAPEAALRQGILFAVAICSLLMLSMFGLLDPAFLLVAILLTGLVEAVWQNRPSARRL